MPEYRNTESVCSESPQRKENFEKIFSSILKTIFTCHFSFILSKNHMGSQAAFYFFFFLIAPQLLGPFILPRLIKKYLFVCSKSKVIIMYIKNTNSIYLNYFCFLTALFW